MEGRTTNISRIINLCQDYICYIYIYIKSLFLVLRFESGHKSVIFMTDACYT